MFCSLGLGFSMIAVVFMVNMYYNMIIAVGISQLYNALVVVDYNIFYPIEFNTFSALAYSVVHLLFICGNALRIAMDRL